MASPTKTPTFVVPAAPATASSYSYAKLRSLWIQAGGDPNLASTMAAVALAESGGKVGALNDNAATGDYSVGLWQINYFGGMRTGRTQQFGAPQKLQTDPLANARAAVALAAGGNGLSNWTTFSSGAYKAFFHPATPQENVADATALAQTQAASPSYVAATTDISIIKSQAVAAAKATQHISDPWIVVNRKGATVTGFGEATGANAPKNVLLIGGVPATKSLFAQQWGSTYSNDFQVMTGRQPTAAEQADILSRGLSVYQLRDELSKGKTFAASPAYRQVGAGIVQQAKDTLGVAPPQEFVRQAIAQNWDAATMDAKLRALPQYQKGPVFKQAALDMTNAYQSIYGPVPKAIANAKPGAPSVAQDIKQHVLAGWKPAEYAMKLRAQPQYKYSPEAQDSALHFLDGMGLLIGSRPTLTAGGKTALPGAPGMA